MLKQTSEAIKEIEKHPVGVRLVVHQAVSGTGFMQQLCHDLSHYSGWWDGKDAHDKETFATKIALIHSEVSEALEGGRKDLSDSHLPHRLAVEVELADAVIRIFDLASAMDLDIGSAMIEKLAYNQQRHDHKRETRAAEGGKKF
jgi:NTP pyrophosphatase (non-canonical NTP hydrolase)